MNDDPKPALDLIGRIYDAALRPELWDGVVESIVAFVGGSRGLLFTSMTTPRQGGFAVPYRLGDWFLQQWQEKYIADDLWSRAAVEKGLYVEGTTVLDQDLVQEHELRQSMVYREFLSQVGLGRLCSGVVFGPGNAAVPSTVCSVFRTLEEPPFEDTERERMKVLVPHLSRAIGVMFRLRDAEFAIAATRASLDRLGCGVLLADANSEIMFANRAARRMLKEGDGMHLAGVRGGPLLRRLAVTDGSARAAVQAAFAECLNGPVLSATHFSRGAAVPRTSGRPAYVLQFAPLGTAQGFEVNNETPRAIVFITDPDEKALLDRSVLRSLYRLSDAESSLAELLCGGARLSEAGTVLGITENTARDYLKNIFHKIGVSRQADLVRVLLGVTTSSAP